MSIDGFMSNQARLAYSQLSEQEQKQIEIIAEYFPALIETNKVTLVDNTRQPYKYKLVWKSKGLTLFFYLSSQTNTPVITEIQRHSN